jgi:hypothetical protein
LQDDDPGTWSRRTGLRGVVIPRLRKQLFFEKKNQKTFASLG